MKNVIVTGANGFVGSHLVRALDEKHVHVFAVVKDENENIDTIHLGTRGQTMNCSSKMLKRLVMPSAWRKRWGLVNLFLPEVLWSMSVNSTFPKIYPDQC